MVQNGALAVLSLDGYKVQGMLPGMTAKGNEDVVPYFLRFSCCQQAVKKPPWCTLCAPWRFILSQCHVQHHHNAEANGKEKGADIGVTALGHFRNQLLHHHIQHRPGGKAQ